MCSHRQFEFQNLLQLHYRNRHSTLIRCRKPNMPTKIADCCIRDALYRIRAYVQSATKYTQNKFARVGIHMQYTR